MRWAGLVAVSKRDKALTELTNKKLLADISSIATRPEFMSIPTVLAEESAMAVHAVNCVDSIIGAGLSQTAFACCVTSK